jgi:hypothetical protein
MSRTLELPDDVYAAVERAAAARGKTPAEWVAEKAGGTAHPRPDREDVQPGPKTLRERLAGIIGSVEIDPSKLREDPNDPYWNHLLQKWREGRL